MTYLDKLASALDAAGIAYIRHERSVFVDDPDTQDAVLLSEDGGLWVDKGVKVGSVIGRAIVTAAEVWREMQEGEERLAADQEAIAVVLSREDWATALAMLGCNKPDGGKRTGWWWFCDAIREQIGEQP